MTEKKKHEFSGADEYQLRSTIERLVRQSERNNVEITLENLKAFYSKQQQEKSDEEDLEKIIEKAKKGGGKGYRSLQKRSRRSMEEMRRNSLKGACLDWGN